MRNTSGAGYAVFLLVCATLFLRPVELIPSLEGAPIYEVLILACLAISSPAILANIQSVFGSNPINTCTLAMLPAVILSHLAHLSVGEGIDSAVAMIKILLYYILVVSLIDSFTRLRNFLLWMNLFVVILLSLALLHYHGIVNIPALEAYHERQWDQVDEETGTPVVLARLQSTGIYGNPNDLSRILVVGILLSLYLLGDNRAGLLRTLWVLPILLFGYGLHLTRSRGGLLSLLGGLFALFVNRYGKLKALLACLVLVPVLLAFGGRQTNMDTSGGTGQERIKIWNEGFVAFQSSPIFGIGMDRYAEEVGIVAHNSFVHCYVELGFFGGTIFFALFYLPMIALFRAHLPPCDVVGRDTDRFRPFVIALITATIVGMLSSSRSYSLPTYLVVGLASAFITIETRQGLAAPLRFDGGTGLRLARASFFTFAALYLYVRVAARY